MTFARLTRAFVPFVGTVAALGVFATPVSAQAPETEPEQDTPTITRAQREVHGAGLHRLNTVLRLLVGQSASFKGRDFSPGFKERRSVDEIENALQTLAMQSGGYENLGIIDHGPGIVTTVVAAKGTGARSRVTVTYELRSPFRIDGILIHPDLPTFQDWPEFTRTLDAADAAGIDASVSIAQLLEDGSLETLFSYRENRQLNIGAQHRLYVMRALFAAFDAEIADWFTTLQIVDALKSPFPSETRDTPAGAPIPLAFLVSRMMLDDDKSATTHLVDYLDTRTLRDTMAEYMADMARNTPALSHLDALRLRLDTGGESVAEWESGDADARRALLREIRTDAEPLEQDDLTRWTEPLGVESVGWFSGAAPLNLLFGQLSIRSGMEQNATLATIIDDLPVAPVDHTVWTYSRIFQSNEPGINASTWMLAHRDGRTFFLSAVFNNPDENLPLPQVGELLIAATETLARAAPRFETDEFLEEEPPGDEGTGG